jgi:hypothetical protein
MMSKKDEEKKDEEKKTTSSSGTAAPPATPPATPPAVPPATPANVNCAMSQWNPCSVPCGGGKQVRTILTPASGSGTACGPLEQPCNIDECPAVIVYDDCDYKGKNQEYRTADKIEIPFFKAEGNDMLSSLKVPAGYKVILYQDADYKGASKEFTADAKCLMDQQFNDQASSMKIMRV